MTYTSPRSGHCAHGFDLVTLHVVLGERHPHVRVVEGHAHLRRRIRFVDGHGERANRHNRHVERRPLPPRFGDHGYRVARHDAAGDESFRERDDLVSEFDGGE